MVAFDAVHPSERYRPMAQDPHPRIAGYRVADASAVAGSAVWLALAGLAALHDIVVSAAGLFLALALLVVTPLSVTLVATRRRSGGDVPMYRLAVLGQPPAALAAVAALVIRSPPLGREFLTLPWLVVGLALAAVAGWRLGSRGLFPLSELAIDAGLLAPLVGAVVLLLGGMPTAEADPSALAIGAVHAHFVGLVLPLVAGLTGRIVTDDRGRFSRALAGILSAGATALFVLVLPLVAVAALDDGTVGLAAVALLTLAGVAVSLSLLTAVAPRVPPLPAVLLAVAAVALVFTLVLALVAATTDFVDTGTMVGWHGTLGGLGVAVPSLVAFRLG
jgi:hypothetical protein